MVEIEISGPGVSAYFSGVGESAQLGAIGWDRLARLARPTPGIQMAFRGNLDRLGVPREDSLDLIADVNGITPVVDRTHYESAFETLDELLHGIRCRDNRQPGPEVDAEFVPLVAI
jgi:hypothetical protein